jgi:acetate kinase
MKKDAPGILTINGGSSSIKFALYQIGELLKQKLHGKIDRIGLSGTNLTFHADGKPQASRKLAAADHKSAANFLIDCGGGWQEPTSTLPKLGSGIVWNAEHCSAWKSEGKFEPSNARRSV